MPDWPAPPPAPPARGGSSTILIGVGGGLALLLALGVAVPVVMVRVARARAERLCAAAIVGGPAAGLEERGRRLGLRMSSYRGRDGRPDTITGVDGFLFSRWFCTIEHADGKVVEKKVSFLD